MSPFLEYFWPVAGMGLALGAILGTVAFRRRRRSLLIIGMAAAIAGAALWHWPLGAADRFTARIEPFARAVLVNWEMDQVEAKLHRDPLSRRLLLSGPADDFQRQELSRMMGNIPGVSTATWSRSGGIPMIVEAALAAVAGFLLGLLLAYLIEIRRRHNAQWKW